MNSSPAPDWLQHAGEMPARIRAHDWSATPLGPLGQWPLALRSAVTGVLDNPFPMVMGWGPDLITIYNDAYRPLLGRKPEALGRPFLDLWSEARDAIAPLVARAVAGESMRYEAAKFSLLRRGEPEEAWFDYSFSPLRDESGKPAGILNTAIEVTERLKAELALREREERQAFLLRFSDALRGETNADAIAGRAISMVFEHLKLDRCYVTAYRPADDAADIPYQIGNEKVAPLPDMVRLSDFPLSWERTREGTLVVDYNSERKGVGEGEKASSAALGLRATVATMARRAQRTPLHSMVAVSARPRAWTAGEIALVEEAAERTWAAMDSARADAALRESEQRLEAAIEVGKIGLWDWDIDTGQVHWSDEHFEMEGYGPGEVEPSYQVWADRLHPDDRQETEAALDRAREGGEIFEQEFRVVHPGGEVRWLNARGRFFRNASGKPSRMIGAVLDVSERRWLEERKALLIGELQHRTLNLIGVVQSVAQSLMRRSADLPDFRKRFALRLDALRRVQRLVSRLGENERISFHKLLESELTAMDADTSRVSLEGPRTIRLPASSVQTLALALHELATNARKYGALAQDGANLAVRWRIEACETDSQRELLVDWLETGVTMNAARENGDGSGLGRELIERALPYQLGARTSYVMARDGVRCRIAVPISAGE